MRIKTVSFGKTVSVNYQGKRAEVTIELEEGESFDVALAGAKGLVELALGTPQGRLDEETSDAVRMLKRETARPYKDE